MARYDIGDLSLTLEELKRKLVVDFDEDNEEIARLGRVAMSQIFHSTHRTVEELTQMGGGEYPSELREAALQLAAHWYRVREAVSSSSQNPVPFGINFLVKPFVKLGDDD